MASEQRSKRGSSAPTPARIRGPRLLLIACVVILMAIGLVMIFSASSIEALTQNGDSAYYVKRQFIMIALGLVGLIGALAIPYKMWSTHLVWIVWGITVLLLALTTIFGFVGLGAKRWLYLGSVGFQPSEFAKISMLLVSAKLVVQLRMREIEFMTFLKLMLIAVGLPLLLIVVQPDLGTTIIAAVGILAVLWFGEVRIGPLLAGLGGLIVIALLLTLFVGFRFDRLVAFLDPWSDPLGAGYQTINAFYAFSEGGLFGVGLGMSRQKFLYLPEAHNDFIFAIIGEELGLVGALSVVALFILFLYAAFKIARRAPDLFGRIIVGASAAMIGFQAFVNIACVIGLAPVTGKPLPFVSYGGTSIIATLILVGLILAVSFRSDVPDKGARRREELLILEGGLPKGDRSKRPESAQGRRPRSTRTARVETTRGKPKQGDSMRSKTIAGRGR